MNAVILPSGQVVHRVKDFGRPIFPRYGWPFRKMTRCGMPVAEDGFHRTSKAISCQRCLSTKPTYWE